MKIAVFDNIAAHYRLPVFLRLSREVSDEYTIFASDNSYNGVKPIDAHLAQVPVSEGGIRWNIIKNIVVLRRIFWQRSIINIILNCDYDVFILPGEFHILSSWIAVIFLSLKKKKVVFWGHGIYGNEKFLKRIFRNWFNRLPDAHLLYGSRARDIMIGNGINPEKLFVVNNSLDYDYHRITRSTITKKDIEKLKTELFGINSNLPSIVFIGRLTREKKIGQLIQSLALLHSRGKKVNCTIIGAGAEEKKLRDLSAELSLEDYITFFGPSYEEHINGLILTMADCCVSPGNVGLNAVHSLTFGTPVITHSDFSYQNPEVSCIIEGNTGEFFEKDNIMQLSLKIEQVIFTNGNEHYRKSCLKMIDDSYNPDYQIKVFRKIIGYLST